MDGVCVQQVVPVSAPFCSPCPDTLPADRDVRVLLADDDPQVRAYTARVLRWAGWDVMSVANGREAVEAWPLGAEPFDVVILDIIMPEMNGFEAYHEIACRHPQARFVFISGYSQDVSLAPYLQEGRSHFVGKPFVPHALVAKVRTALEEGHRDAGPIRRGEGGGRA